MNLVATFPGLGYSELRNLPVTELEILHQEAERIRKARS